MEIEFFIPLPSSTAGRVDVGHPISFINIAHVTVIIRHNYRLYCVAVFIEKIAFTGWIMNIRQDAHTIAVNSPLVLT